MDKFYVVGKESFRTLIFQLDFKKYFGFSTLQGILRNGRNSTIFDCMKNFKLLKYEHIKYNFEARDLEISNM